MTISRTAMIATGTAQNRPIETGDHAAKDEDLVGQRVEGAPDRVVPWRRAR